MHWLRSCTLSNADLWPFEVTARESVPMSQTDALEVLGPGIGICTAWYTFRTVACDEKGIAIVKIRLKS